VRRAGGHRPVAVTVGPVPPLGRVIHKARPTHRFTQRGARAPGGLGYVRVVGVAEPGAVLGVGVDKTAHVNCRAVASQEEHVDGCTGGMWRNIGRRDEPAGKTAQALHRLVRVDVCQPTQLAVEDSCLDGGLSPPLVQGQGVVRRQQLRGVHQPISDAASHPARTRVPVPVLALGGGDHAARVDQILPAVLDRHVADTSVAHQHYFWSAVQHCCIVPNSNRQQHPPKSPRHALSRREVRVIAPWHTVRTVLIATDLDGTLVPDGSTSVSAYTAGVLKQVDHAGIPVVFVTGRPLRWMDPFWPHVGQHGLAVVSNGAITFDVHGREVVTMAGIEPALGLDITAAITDAVPGATFAIECLDGIRQDPDFIDRYRVPDGSPRGPLAEIWDAPAVKLLVRHETLGHGEFRDRVIAAVGELAHATWSAPGLVEISCAGVTKASALVALCARLGIASSDVVAFGDMPNDIPMLAWAGTSYAMASAHESVHAVADRIAPPCEDEGVAHVLDTLLGNPGCSD
jgi:Cof subfamily protein (haloacid dehalogenase superfamily)